MVCSLWSFVCYSVFVLILYLLQCIPCHFFVCITASLSSSLYLFQRVRYDLFSVFVFICLFVCHSVFVMISLSVKVCSVWSLCLFQCVRCDICVCYSVFVMICRPDMTFAVDWALSNNYLSIYRYDLFVCYSVFVRISLSVTVCSLWSLCLLQCVRYDLFVW